jgi:hypothetical protein
MVPHHPSSGMVGRTWQGRRRHVSRTCIYMNFVFFFFLFFVAFAVCWWALDAPSGWLAPERARYQGMKQLIDVFA